ncbi:MAG: SdrD B-like domain-containing protein [Longimicrobiales bacterium]
MSTYLRRLTVAALAVAVFGVTACDDGTDPVASATVEILAYIDANNSNDNDAGDVPIEGATVTLTMVGSDAVELTETTGSDGVATFEAVEIGSYTATIEPPEGLTGVTLASASTPSVVADEEGVTVSASFRYTYNPGAIMGHVFIGDSYGAEVPAVPGVTVTVSQGGTEITSAETDAGGAFSAGGLLPGDYDVAVDVPAYLTAASATETVTLAAEDSATVDFGMAIGTTSTVADARAAAVDDTVTIVGIAITATAGDSASLSSSSFYMQDASGISIYLADVDMDVLLGDSILIYGERGTFGGEVQLETLAAIALGEGTLPTPTEATAADVNGAMYQGQLVTVQSLMVDSMSTGSSGADVWTSEYETGEDVLLYVDATTGLDTTNFTVGTVYNVTGVAARYNDLLELKPRVPSDIVEDPSPGTSVADVRAEADGTPVTTYAVVTEAGTLEGNGFYMQDATAGIFVYMGYGNTPPADLAIGDVVMVEGERGSYYDTQQIVSPTITEQWVATTPVKPTDVTSAELSSGDFQGQLVTLTQVTVDSIDGSDMFVTDAAGDTAVVRIDSDSGLGTAGFTVGEVYTFTGVVYNSFSTERLKPRFESDVSGYTPPDTAKTIAEARAADLGSSAEVSGVITVDVGNFGNETYLQDGEAAITVYPGNDALVEGDSVTISGTLEAYSGNLQIRADSTLTVVLGTGTVPSPVTLTGTEVNAGSNPAELVTLSSFTVETVETFNYDNHLVTGAAADGDTVQVYVDSRSGIASGDWTVGTTYSVTGVMNYRDPDWRIKPRKPADVVAQ